MASKTPRQLSSGSRSDRRSTLPETEFRAVNSGISRWILALVLAASLTWIFWWPLWTGGGLIGGDLYTYYFPQKTYLAESLRAGTIPLWNALAGFGYPVLGESQTGAVYPVNLLLYPTLGTNAAYNISQLGHYLLAFCGMFALSKRLGIGTAGSLLAALAFVFGWFPPRICLEWAIIGGAWCVWILWAAVAYLKTSQRRFLVLLAIFLALDLLAGHYNLAFITLLMLLPLPWMVGQGTKTAESNTTTASPLLRRIMLLALAVGVGFLMASVQLLSSWELKSLSHRQRVNEAFLPTYGHLPVEAVSQLWMPWRWYAGEQTMDQQLAASRLWTVPSATNQVEAQLYVGLLPFLLAIIGVVHPGLRKTLPLKRPWYWLAVIVVSLILATGWPSYWLPWLPGLSYFRGPGRFSLVAAWALSLLAGASFEAVLARINWGKPQRSIVSALVLMLTTCDLWAASRQYQFGVPPFLGRQVFYATLLDQPPVVFLPESPLRKHFTQKKGTTRLYAPGQQCPSMLGVSAIPLYLGLGPEIYESDEIRVDFSLREPKEIADAMSRLKRLGVTHILTEQPLDSALWPVQSRGSWLDPFLNRALGRSEPFYLYEIPDAPSRVSLITDDPENRILRVDVEPNRVRVDVECHSNCQLVLRDLVYPGWELVNPRQQQTHFDEHFRSVPLSPADSVDGQQTVEWVYRPASLVWGLVLSFIGVVAVLALALVPQRRSPGQPS